MLKKRIAGVITVYNGLAIQSFGYHRFLPLGNPVHLAENLSRWGSDEIIVLDIGRSKKNLGPDLELLKEISSSGVNIPLTYGGGINSVKEAAAVISAGSERVILDNLLHNNLETVCKISNYLGAQAVVGSFPLSFAENGSINWYNHVDKKDKKLSKPVLDILDKKIISEALIIDRDHEGTPNTFDATLIEKFPIRMPVIAFGGLSIKHELSSIIDNPYVVSVAIGNPLNYFEHSIQRIKSQLREKLIRKASYCSDKI
jgi:imidazole glycerol-phosphate synthase subunit HisF